VPIGQLLIGAALESRPLPRQQKHKIVDSALDSRSKTPVAESGPDGFSMIRSDTDPLRCPRARTDIIQHLSSLRCHKNRMTRLFLHYDRSHRNEPRR